MTKKGRGSKTGFTLHGHLPFFHGFQQRALCLRGCPIDFIGKNHTGKNGPRMEDKRRAGLVKNRNAQNISREKIAGKLNTLIPQPQHPGQCMREGCLAHSWQIFD